MKRLNQFIILITFVVTTVFVSCKKFDIVRIMDTKTDNIEINSSEVVASGTILDIGESQIIQHGHCWSITENPTVDNHKSELGAINERNSFTSQLTEIVPGVEHYVRSYVYDGNDYAYGNPLTFTLSADDIDFVTEPAERIDESTVLINSDVGNIGSITFDNHGHCWSLTDPPVIDDSRSSYGLIDGNHEFSSNINNLNLGRYYIRAYMDSEGGVVYSNTVVFESIISVYTGQIVQSDETIIMSGNIRSLGVKPILNHGHCWSAITSSPSANNNHNSLGTLNKLGSFSSEIEGLLPDVTYYIRSYATDSVNVYYGEIKSFKPTK
ncbi:MAG: hypothetical protein B6I20_13345 [Bacteroidetes bacterium 4572_117]|nr:MAG: hypothetical protein B6I20_13345 [Bacteroidetes bacterium 4572_117]